jgi:hypothetical protein
MIIRVKQKHIKNGSDDAENCPIALALKEAFPLSRFSVGLKNIYRFLPRRTIRITPTRSVVRFIKKFDDGKKVTPFNFKYND